MKKIKKTLLLSTSLMIFAIPTTTMAQDDNAALRAIIEAVRVG